MTLEEPPHLGLEDVSFGFRGAKRALFSSLSFELPVGQICGLIGPSGAGKSTLLRLLSGQLSADGGVVRRPEGSHKGMGVLYHPQEALLLPWATVRENALVGQRLARLPAAASPERVLAQLGLDSLCDSFPARLSGGQAERVALARTLLTPAAAYLFDEPLSGTDYVLRVRIEEVLVDLLRAGGVSAIIVTHDLPQAVAMSDFIVVLVETSGNTDAVRVDLPQALRSAPPRQRRASAHLGPFVQQLLGIIEPAE